jgi:3-hydroxybutyryl-CoA dehydrogenase
MKGVEVVRNEATSRATQDTTTFELARRFGKEPVLINREIPGFVADSWAIQKEALALHTAGIATREDIDTTAKTALGHPMQLTQKPVVLNTGIPLSVAERQPRPVGQRSNEPRAQLVLVGSPWRPSGSGRYMNAAGHTMLRGSPGRQFIALRPSELLASTVACQSEQLSE